MLDTRKQYILKDVLKEKKAIKQELEISLQIISNQIVEKTKEIEQIENELSE